MRIDSAFDLPDPTGMGLFPDAGFSRSKWAVKERFGPWL